MLSGDGVWQVRVVDVEEKGRLAVNMNSTETCRPTQ